MSDEPIIVNQRIQRKTITKPDGTTQIIATVTTTSMVNQTSGQTITEDRHLLQGASGRMIDPQSDQPTSCILCGANPLGKADVTECGCGRTVCRVNCTKTVHKERVCKICAKEKQNKELKDWVFSLDESPKPNTTR